MEYQAGELIPVTPLRGESIAAAFRRQYPDWYERWSPGNSPLLLKHPDGTVEFGPGATPEAVWSAMQDLVDRERERCGKIADGIVGEQTPDIYADCTCEECVIRRGIAERIRSGE